jgi:hypothetical protein
LRIGARTGLERLDRGEEATRERPAGAARSGADLSRGEPREGAALEVGEIVEVRESVADLSLEVVREQLAVVVGVGG